MDVSQYYITTLTNAAVKIGPIVGFILVGYFIFVKLPFLFFLTNMKKSKEALKVDKPEEKTIEKKNTMAQGPLRLDEPKKAKVEPKKEQKKAPPKKEPAPDFSAETLFEINPGDPFTKNDLKKKYHELLRMNHPDKVAALSPEFKQLADKKTKEINTAYAKLLKRAA